MTDATGWMALATGGSALAYSARSAVRGWRKRIETAQTVQFTVGGEALATARSALELKNQMIAELQAQRLKLVEDAAHARAKIGVQGRLIEELQVDLGAMRGENAELRTQVERAQRREEDYRRRIRDLEGSLEDVRKQLGLGLP